MVRCVIDKGVTYDIDRGVSQGSFSLADVDRDLCDSSCCFLVGRNTFRLAVGFADRCCERHSVGFALGPAAHKVRLFSQGSSQGRHSTSSVFPVSLSNGRGSPTTSRRAVRLYPGCFDLPDSWRSILSGPSAPGSWSLPARCFTLAAQMAINRDYTDNTHFPRYHSTVLRRPSSKFTLGLYPRCFSAREMSARECLMSPPRSAP